jgi:hypothetical protein
MTPQSTLTTAFELIPKTVLDGLAPMLTTPAQKIVIDASVVVQGELTGSSVSSVPFNYSVSVCNGCLTTDAGKCATVVTTNLPTGYPCTGDLQDVALACCTTTTGAKVCPAMQTTM